MVLKRDLSQWILVIVAAALLVTNGLLIFQNNGLRTALEQSKKFVTDVGYRFADLPGTTLDGTDAPIKFSVSGKNTLLLVLDTNCEYCLQQYPYWKALIGKLDEERWQVVAVTVQRDASLISKHLEENNLSGIDVRIVQFDAIQKARLGYTPMTIAVTSDGVVKNVWPGLWAKGFNLEN
jgi:hypothetical protein